MHIIIHIWSTRKIISEPRSQSKQGSMCLDARFVPQGNGRAVIIKEITDEKNHEVDRLDDWRDAVDFPQIEKSNWHTNRVRSN